MTNRYLQVAAPWAVALLLASCGGSRAYPAPAEPEIAVRGFLNAVQANSLVGMGELWGNDRGPAVSYMDREELEKRLTIIRAYLQHEGFEILPATEAPLSQSADERIVQVRLTRAGCAPVVPFTVTRYRTGWLVKQVDLETAGNPSRRCR